MKELAKSFETILKKDRALIWWMAANFAVSLYLFLLPLASLNLNKAKIYVRYTDIGVGYVSDVSWYLLSFSILAIVLGVVHTLICVRFYERRGKDVARLLLGISIAISIMASRYLLCILGEG